MVKPIKIQRGEIWLVELVPTVGAEIQKTRPAVIVSPPELHDWLRTAFVAPMTTGSHAAPFRVPLTFKGKRGLILPEQVRAVDKTRLVKRLGKLDPATLAQLLSVLRDTFED